MNGDENGRYWRRMKMERERERQRERKKEREKEKEKDKEEGKEAGVDCGKREESEKIDVGREQIMQG